MQHHIAMQHVQMWLQQAQSPDVNLPRLSGSGWATAATRASELLTGWAVVTSACVDVGRVAGASGGARAALGCIAFGRSEVC